MSAPMPADLPSIANARLPKTYETAKAALAECTQIDECKDWADKAEAMAAYARMSEDDALRKMADKVKAQAIRRCGELLKQYDGRGNNQHKVAAALSNALPLLTQVCPSTSKNKPSALPASLKKFSRPKWKATIHRPLPPWRNKARRPGHW